jgi:hypothetical protein
MANVNSPYGLQWLGDLSAGLQGGAVNEYIIPSSDSNNYFLGDPVKSTGTATTDGVPTITAAAAGDTLRGVIVGFKPATQASPVYGEASTTRTVYVVDAPYAQFLIQSNGTGVVGDMGANADITTSTAGSTVTGVSGVQLDESSVTLSSAQLRILRKYPIVNNDMGANVKYVVMINEHELKSTSGV